MQTTLTDECEEDVEQDGITKVKILYEISTKVCIKRTIEFPNMKWRQQLKMNNHIHLHNCSFLLVRPEVESKFNKHLNILMIDIPKKIWIPEVKNRYIPLDYSDDIDDGFFVYTCYGKAVFKPKFYWKAYTWNDLIIYNY